MKLRLLKWYFYVIMNLKKTRIIKTMSKRIHADNYPLVELHKAGGIEKTVEDLQIDCTLTAATNKDKVNCPDCIEIISANRQDV